MSDAHPKHALVVTSINAPQRVMRGLAAGCIEHDWRFYVAGDRRSPVGYELAGAEFLSLEKQRQSGFSLALSAPEGTYTRKNLGYLEAMRGGAGVIIETDDDNHPGEGFWSGRSLARDARIVAGDRWVNTYAYFTDGFIYPRGLPLDHARETPPPASSPESVLCPIQQGLADEDPDVDAVYRMLFPLPYRFEKRASPVFLREGAWCPFNSQNTSFFPVAFPLLYLPAYCSFRMTDIWRGFVAQRILHARGSGLLFHAPTVWQERNEHNLHRDFVDEMPGYQNNQAIREALVGTHLDPRMGVRIMMEKCYETMIRHGWVGAGEETLLAHWFRDLENLGVI